MKTARSPSPTPSRPGLDYALVGPEHAWLHDRHRAEYVSVDDAGALDAARLLCRLEGLIPALESAHAIAEAIRRAPAAKGKIFIVNLSGRGDKDIDIYRENLKELDSALMPATRIAGMFAGLKRDGRKGLIAYITAGDPTPDRTADLVAALERGGADLIELGVPFSDPIADGPVIQRAGERALRAGTSLRKVLDIAAEIRRRSQIPLLLFTYLNPVMRYGLEKLASDAADVRHRWLPAHRRQRGRGAGLRRRHASPRAGYCVSRRAHQHRTAPQAGGAVLHRLRLPGLPHGRDRRARLALGRGRPRWCRPCARSRTCRSRWASAFPSRSTWPNWAARWKLSS